MGLSTRSGETTTQLTRLDRGVYAQRTTPLHSTEDAECRAPAPLVGSTEHQTHNVTGDDMSDGHEIVMDGSQWECQDCWEAGESDTCPVLAELVPATAQDICDWYGYDAVH